MKLSDVFDHGSPSMVNEYINNPGIWAYKYVAKIRDRGKAEMWRGTAVEAGATVLLHGSTIEEAVREAYHIYDQIVTKNFVSPLLRNTTEIQRQRCLIGPMLGQVKLWTPPHLRPVTQIKVEHYFGGIDLLIIGFIDFGFNDIDVDCKSTTKIVNELEPGNHARQISFYREARQKRGGLLYVTDKKFNFLEVNDELKKYSLNQMREALIAMRYFLNHMPDRAAVIRSLNIDWDNWAAPADPKTTDQIIEHMRQHR